MQVARIHGSGDLQQHDEPIPTPGPGEALVRVTAADSVIAGVRLDGRLVRSSDAGATWQPVGPPDVRFADVALQELLSLAATGSSRPPGGGGGPGSPGASRRITGSFIGAPGFAIMPS